MFNRGFEILPKVHGLAYAVAAESLYRKYDHGAKQYGEVPAADREWLTGQMRRVQSEYKLPAIFIDYVPAADFAPQPGKPGNPSAASPTNAK